MNQTNILLTGASGTVGSEVLKILCKDLTAYNVTVFDIKSKKSQQIFSPFKNKINIVYGDISNEKYMSEICKGKDIVIHLAGIIPPLADDYPALAHRVNVLGTKNLVNGLGCYAPNAFLLYSSSVSVYGDRLHTPFIKVGDALVPSEEDEYAVTKIEAEKIIKNSQLNWSIFRLTGIMGKHHGPSKLMFHMPLETSLEMSIPRDAARAFVNAIKHQDVLSKKIYNLSGGEKMQLTYKEYLERAFEAFGLGVPDFPEYAFATRNFHCGFFTDGDDLENILHFRSGTKEGYFKELQQSVSPVQRFFTKLFRKLILRQLAQKSEPLAAVKNHDRDRIKHFFGKNIKVKETV